MNESISELRDTQKSNYKRLLEDRLPKLIKDFSCTFDDSKFKLDCEMFPIDWQNIVTKNETDYYPVRALCQLTNQEDNERVSFNIGLLNVPVFYELGFKIGGNYMQVLDAYKRSAGWSFTIDDRKEDPIITAAALDRWGRSFTFMFDHRKRPFVVFKVGKDKKKKNVPVSVFFRALTGMSNIELLNKFGRMNPFLVAAFSNHRKNDKAETVEDCIEILADSMLGEERSKRLSSLGMKLMEIRRSLFSANYFDLGADNMKRFEITQSFIRRVTGKTLGENITCGDVLYEKGTVITRELAEILDAMPLDSLRVQFNGKTYQLRKFSKFSFQCLNAFLAEDLPELNLRSGSKISLDDVKTLNNSQRKELKIRWGKNAQVSTLTRRTSAETLTIEDLFTAFSIWMDNVNGFDVYDKPYELTNRVCVSFDDKIYNHVANSLRTMFDSLSVKVSEFCSNSTLLLAVSEMNATIDQDAFIDEVKSVKEKEGQMSETCNILAYLSKSNKLTTDMGKSKNVPSEMREVQGSQEGRIDPYDSPESGKVGLVHHKTMFSSTDSSGQILAPYLEVKNGKVVSNEPVMLSAIEESNKYVASWNETFTNEDGSKKEKITVRVNGNVTVVDCDKVTYKEYSPLQSMSIMHGLMTLPNHSNGKRIIMSCNEGTQILHTVSNPERPLVGTGVESIMDYGTYVAKDVVADYLKEQSQFVPELMSFEDEIKDSPLKLVSILDSDSRRTLVYEVLKVKEINKRGYKFDPKVSITVPYNMKNFQDATFSYRVNHKTDKIYESNDVLAYCEGFSLENRERVDLVDFGGYVPPEGTFDRGLALGHNLLCGYKTFSTSTIEDAISISDRLLYDDTMTHLRIIEIRVKIFSDGRNPEKLGCTNNSGYFEVSGLPKLGTVLKPGDKVVSKIPLNSTRPDGKVFPRYKRLGPTQEGMVIKTEVVKKNKHQEAHVFLATRASIENGDKMAGRHGNKGVIARIVPEREMPYDPVSGRTLDICVNPLGVPSRMNISQILEAALAMCRLIDGKSSYVSPYHPDDLKFIREQVAKFEVHPVMMIDGRTGEYFKRPINVGPLYMNKLQQVAAGRVHAIGMNAPMDPAFLQPRKGSKADGGQRIGEMENWCLHGVGATHLLNDIYGIQSDDAIGREKFINNYQDSPATSPEPSDDYNVNMNDAVLLALIRSLGSELVSDSDTNSYYTKPLTDDIIKAFSAMPIETEAALHSPDIFGYGDSAKDKENDKKKWGWIDLGTEIIHPTWIHERTFSKWVSVEKQNGSVGNLLPDLAEKIISGEAYVIQSESKWRLIENEAEFEQLRDDEKEASMTGMAAVVAMIRSIDLEKKLKKLETTLADDYSTPESRESQKYLDLIAELASVREFMESGNKPDSFIISSFPVMPQSFRMKLEDASFGNTKPDFDHYYIAIISAANRVRSDQSVGNVANLYSAIKDFIGFGVKKDQKYKNVLKYFLGKDENDDHGKIRSAVQSKRVLCSGRAVITPGSERISPREIGVPAIMLVKMYHLPLVQYFIAKMQGGKTLGNIHDKDWERLFLYIANQDQQRFSDLFLSKKAPFYECLNLNARKAFYEMKKWLVEFFEVSAMNPNPAFPDLPYRIIPGQTRPVVLCGRQPSLHKYSLRAFHPVVLWTRAIEINVMTCTGFNADFDGDMEYVFAALTEESKAEAMAKLAADVDFINPKDSTIMLKHTQDIALGCYVATMLENNAEVYDKTIADAHYYNDTNTLEYDVMHGVINVHDLVCLTIESRGGDLSKYLSTAGRILFNACFQGFTDDEFTNTLKIKGVQAEKFRNLKYDGLISIASGSSGDLQYYNLNTICMELFKEFPDDCIDDYFSIELFGFKMSDLFSVTLSLEDFELASDKDAILKEADAKRMLVEDDYQNGLVSEEDKRDAIASIYNNSGEGALARIEKNLVSKLPRNNNLFIMMDSGARGKKSQLVHMCGAIGILDKNKKERMESPVTSNYFEGLTTFDVHMASYSARTGLASTQMETKNAGYATRKVVYMADGSKIVAKDCGKPKWWFKCEWGDRIDDLSRFKPTKNWLNKLDGVILEVDGKTEFSEDDILTEGFNELKTDTNVYKAGPELLKGSKLVDDEGQKYFSQVLKNGMFDNAAVMAFDYYKTKELKTTFGELSCRYRLSNRCRSELLHREARGLPDLWHVTNGDGTDEMNVITEKTLGAIEKAGNEVIEARIMLDCACKNGVCAHCYGLKYSSLSIPEVGDIVGTESAQSIGEPAAQLTLDVINQGGVGSGSTASGLEVFSMYLNGSIVGGKKNRFADVPERSGYVRIRKLDNNVSISVEPVDKSCKMCKECLRECGASSASGCPLVTGNTEFDPHCSLKKKTPLSMVCVRDGEWVKSGDPVTRYPTISDNIVSVDDNTSNAVVLRKKQMVWVDNYFNIFEAQGINARHFELLAMVQNKMALVTYSQNPDFKVGKSYNIDELRNAESVEYQMRTSDISETIMTNSGLLTALTFAEQSKVLGAATFVRRRSSVDETAEIGKISVGQSLGTSEVKHLNNVQIFISDNARTANKFAAKDIDFVKMEKISNLALDSQNIEDFDDIDLGFDFDGTDEMSSFTQDVQSDFEAEVDPEILSYSVQYFLDGVAQPDLEEFLEGTRGDTIVPDSSKIPDGYVLTGAQVLTLEDDGDEFTFHYSKVEEKPDSNESFNQSEPRSTNLMDFFK